MGRVITRLWVLAGPQGAEYRVGSGGVEMIVERFAPYWPDVYEIVMNDGARTLYPKHLVGVEWTTKDDEQDD